MGMVTRPQLQAWLVDWHQGDLPFEAEDVEEPAYMNYVAELELQPQLQAAYKLIELGTWTRADYDYVRGVLEYEYDDSYSSQAGEVKCFNAFEVKGPGLGYDPEAFERYQQALRDGVNPEQALKDYTDSMGVVAPTGHVKASEGVSKSKRSKKTQDPLRGKSGQFEYGVGQLWFYDVRTGRLDQRSFTGKNALASAFGQCAAIQATWEAEGLRGNAAWVKVRIGGRKLNAARKAGVVLVDARGMICMPQDVVRLHGQAKGQGIKSSVGEVTCQTSVASIILMLEQNKMYVGDNDLLCIDVPSVEPINRKEVVYSVRYLSGSIRTINVQPLSDIKDDDGNVTLTGHKKRAYEILIESPSAKSDSASVVKYVMYENPEGKAISQEQWVALGEKGAEFKAKTHTYGRDEAILWDQKCHEDPTLTMLSKGYEQALKLGMITDVEREQYLLARWTRLEEIEKTYLGKQEAKARYQEELAWALGEKIITQRSYDFLVNCNHPAFRERSGPAMHEPNTRVDYHEDGTLSWQRAKNDGGPGYNWVGNMSSLEVQLYNCASTFKF